MQLLALKVPEIDGDALTDHVPKELALVDRVICVVNELRPVVEGDSELDAVLEPDKEETDEADPVVVIVVETDDVGDAVALALEEIVPVTLDVIVTVPLVDKVADTEKDALEHEVDETLPV